MLDPFPGRELLDKADVRLLMGMERTSFERWLKSDEAQKFPKPVVIGRTPKGKPVLKWKKTQVFAWIELL